MTTQVVTAGETNYFRISWRVWRFLGAIDLNDGNLQQFRYWISLILNLVSSSLTLALLMLTFSSEKALENLWNLNLSLTSVATIAKFVVYVKQINVIRETEILLEQLNKRVNTQEQRNYHSELLKKSHFVLKLFMFTFGMIVLNMNFSFLLLGERSLPLPAWMPLDWKNSLPSYLLAIIYQLFTTNIQILQNFVDDSFPPYTLCLIAGHCEMLIMRISSIGHEHENLNANEEELIKCIQDQEKLYSLLELIMRAISWPMLVQFVVIAVNVGNAMCIVLFYVEDTQEGLYYVCFICGLALEIFPACYYGTLVQDVFDRLHYAIFCSNWVDQTRIFRRNVIILSERTKQLPKLMAGQMIEIALTTFMANCKAAYSLCTLFADARSEQNTT